ncbi:hypothetical protein AVEN_168184-1 [Araneus ventricosus]|uniref:Uncharacterized protein n=1 Tax=Araneus ventricosus TaxID=182803 RepID=A0A4Y2UK82_ARAVE|nr:hypothetical protein AVEN_168184-1 [Araneus ventricosus]
MCACVCVRECVWRGFEVSSSSSDPKQPSSIFKTGRQYNSTKVKNRISRRKNAGDDISHQLKKYPTGQAVTHLQTSSVKMMEEIARSAIPARRQPLPSEVEKAFKSPSSSTKMKDSVRQLL